MAAKKITLSIYPNAMADFHIQRADRTRGAEKLHFHDYFQVCYVVRGSITHYYGSTAKGMGKGDAFIITPGQNHSITMHDGAVFYSVSFFLSFLGTNEKLDPLFEFLSGLDPANINPPAMRTNVTFEPAVGQKVENILALMLGEFGSLNVEKTTIVHGLLITLLALFSRAYHALPVFQQSQSRYEAARKSILIYIDKLMLSFTQPVTLDDAVRDTMMNKSFFCKMFLDVTGFTFKQYLNRLRIHYAIEIILTTNNAIATIAEMAGYRDFTTFYRNFLSVTGISPAKYRALRYNLSE